MDMVGDGFDDLLGLLTQTLSLNRVSLQLAERMEDASQGPP